MPVPVPIPPPHPPDHPPRHLSPEVPLCALPDDVLLRIIALAGPLGHQIGVAYTLGALSQRFRPIPALFVSSLPVVRLDCLTALSLSDAIAARSALRSFFNSACAVRHLNLAGCSSALLSPPAMTALSSAAARSLRKVNLAHCRLSDAVLAPLLCAPALRELILVSCDGPTGIAFHPERCTAPLETLDLSWVHTLSRDGVRAIAQLSSLRRLTFTGCEAVSTRTLRAFTTTNIRHSLLKLVLSYCPVGDADLFELLRSVPNLKRLELAEQTTNLWSTGDFTSAGIERLREMYPRVEICLVT